MAWVGWGRWHLSGKCVRPGWSPRIILRAGFLLELPWCGHFWELLFPQWTFVMCPWLGLSKAEACEWGAGENPPLPASLRRLGHHHLASIWAGSGASQGSQVLQRLSRCDCASFRLGPQAESACHQVQRACPKRESVVLPLPPVGQLTWCWLDYSPCHGGEYQAQRLKWCHRCSYRDSILHVKNVNRVDVYVFNRFFLPTKIKRNYGTQMSLLGSESVY